MNKKALVIIILVVGAGAALLVVMNGRRQQGLEKTLVEQSQASVPAQSGTVNVDISGFGFKTQVLKVKTGTKVIWTNQDSADHTVTSDEGGELDSELFGKNQTYEHTFTTAGTHRYYCKPHPGMVAAVIVVD